MAIQTVVVEVAQVKLAKTLPAQTIRLVVEATAWHILFQVLCHIMPVVVVDHIRGWLVQGRAVDLVVAELEVVDLVGLVEQVVMLIPGVEVAPLLKEVDSLELLETVVQA
jgi:hypothetical protein